MNSIKGFIFNKNPLLILSYLSKNILNDNISSHIAKKLSLGLGSVHGILKEFERLGIVSSKRVGKSVLYEVKKEEPIIKAFRVFDNLLEIQPLVESLKTYTRKIILFGSCAKGEDKLESDIDLLILADESEKSMVMNILSEYEIEREIKPIIIDIVELIEMESNDTVFYKEIMKGIELWESTNE